MKICLDCKEIFYEGIISKNEYVTYSHGPKLIEEIEEIEELCPFCKSEDIVNAVKCVVCRKYSEDWVCEECLEEQITLKNALLMWSELDEEYRGKKPTKETARDYLLDDKGYFTEWLSEQIERGEL